MSSSSEALVDHIADYLRFISKTQSLFNKSYDHGCHLANRFPLDPEEYEALLIVAGPASYTRFGWLPNQDHGQLVVTMPSLVLSLSRPLVLLSCRLVVTCVASQRTTLSSSRLVVASSPLVVLLLHRPLVISSCSAHRRQGEAGQQAAQQRRWAARR
jgi:hypothetical protein